MTLKHSFADVLIPEKPVWWRQKRKLASNEATLNSESLFYGETTQLPAKSLLQCAMTLVFQSVRFL